MAKNDHVLEPDDLRFLLRTIDTYDRGLDLIEELPVEAPPLVYVALEGDRKRARELRGKLRKMLGGTGPGGKVVANG